jgi:iron complex transport system substrate-binding protein
MRTRRSPRAASAAALLLALLPFPAVALDCAPGMRPFAHAAGEDCIPDDPQRIVTLQDQNALLPLLELGVRPVGSTGHIQEDGTRIFRRTDGFDTGGIAFVGAYGEPDAEAVAALAPDLIIASSWPEGAHETYSRIAPTVVIDVHGQPLEDALMQFADLVGRSEEAEALRAETEAEAEALRERLGPALTRTTVSVITSDGDGTFYAMEPGQAWGTVRRLLDPVMTAPETGWEPEREPKSLEALGEHEADVMGFLSFDADDGGASSSFDAFSALPVVQALPVAQAGQLVHLDGAAMVGASWGKIRNGLDQVGAALARGDLRRDLVAE